MVEDIASQRKSIGNACLALHHNTAQVHRRFLRRNLRHILDSHSKLLRQDSNDSPYEDMIIANEKRSWGWDFPTTVMLEELKKGEKPILQLESLQIRHPDSTARIKKRAREELECSHDLDWLVDPRVSAVWPCTVGVSVHSTSATTTHKRTAHVESLPAKILRSRDIGDHSRFDIKLDKPCFIEIEKLFVVEESGSNGSRHWKRTVTASYNLEITIQCQDSDDSAEFLSQLEGKEVSSYRNSPGSEGMLKVTWEELPKCPPDGHLMTMKRPKSHKSLELKYQLEVAMGWISRRDSRLKAYNKLMDRRAEMNGQLPTPSASDDLERATKRYEIAWNFRENSKTRSMITKSLVCPLCRGGREFPDFDRLRLHCNRFHSHFTFETENVTERPGSSTFRASIALKPAPLQAEDDHVPDDPRDKMNWVAPARPFNLSAHLRGVDDWAVPIRTKGNNKTIRGKVAKEKDPMPAPAISRKRPAPDEVEDLPAPRPKKHRVPNVPDVSFYRTTSKQPIRAGEYIAESDDAVDESWLAQNEGRALEDLGITGASKEFTRAFNQHLAREQSDSSILTRDALVRFARAYRDELKDVLWQRHFRAKLNQLHQAGIVGEDIVAHCVSVLPSADVSAEEATAPGADKENDASNIGRKRSNELRNGGTSASPVNGDLPQRERKRWTSGKTVPRDATFVNGDVAAEPIVNGSRDTPNAERLAEQITKANDAIATSNARIRAKLCTCGESAKDARGGIACADRRCVRQDYHLKCVGLQRRIPDWRCRECERARSGTHKT